MRPHLSVEQRQLALRLHAEGWPVREIGPQAGCAFATVGRIARRGSWRPVRGDGWVPGPGRLLAVGGVNPEASRGHPRRRLTCRLEGCDGSLPDQRSRR